MALPICLFPFESIFNKYDEMSRIEDQVCEKIQARAKLGLAKYGTTMERTDLSTKEWLNHALEESMDLCIYLMRVIEELDEQKQTVERNQSNPE